ncbi:Calponin homology domain-containing protein [Caenorhabditis elegans]|uniref:Calponin homology domain-containing protein n=1 Tax=Caenorhabditis elegans TaxID=6239 RepID=Q965L0_CAEEL|nr:Calponin homology domain-containing protein [Caenorhabditis elegans]CCD68524.2 Calponin homology domain-containing protein [Caenorhabditis elegans]|eukprot:NP_501432.4 Uncharacterized protein CELE_M116.5 [Caenorhabditis elegans]
MVGEKNRSQHKIDPSDAQEKDILDHYELNRGKFNDVRDTMQKKTFTKWVNKHLTKTDHTIVDLFVDLRDGFALIALLEALTGERIQRENGYTRFHRIQNVQYCLDFLKMKNIKLVNIRPEDIVEGNGKLTLGLIWTIILNFQVSVIRQRLLLESSQHEQTNEKHTTNSQDSIHRSETTSARDALLQWAKRTTAEYPRGNVINFSNSWRDGLAFNAIIHRYRSSAIDWNKINSDSVSNTERLNIAFAAADREFGVERLLDAEDVDTNNPDEKSIITYVSSLYNALPQEPEMSKFAASGGKRLEEEIGKLQADADHIFEALAVISKDEALQESPSLLLVSKQVSKKIEQLKVLLKLVEEKKDTFISKCKLVMRTAGPESDAKELDSLMKHVEDAYSDVFELISDKEGLIDRCNASNINSDSVPNTESLNLAFAAADPEFGAGRLLDAEDVDTNNNPDEKPVITYVSSLKNAPQDPEMSRLAASGGKGFEEEIGKLQADADHIFEALAVMSKDEALQESPSLLLYSKQIRFNKIQKLKELLKPVEEKKDTFISECKLVMKTAGPEADTKELDSLLKQVEDAYSDVFELISDKEGLIDRCNASNINSDSVSNTERLNIALAAADAEFGAGRLLDAEDVDTNNNPDEKSIITYVSSLNNAFPLEPEMSKYVASGGKRLEEEIGKLQADADHIFKALEEISKDEALQESPSLLLDSKQVSKKIEQLKVLLKPVEEKKDTFISESKLVMKTVGPESDAKELDSLMKHVEDAYSDVVELISDKEGLIDRCNASNRIAHPQTETEKITNEIELLKETCSCCTPYQIEKISENYYRFGDTHIKRMVRILRSTVMVRVGGGWEPLEESLQKHDPCRTKGRLNINMFPEARPIHALDLMQSFTKNRHAKQMPIAGTPGPIMKIREKTERSVPMSGGLGGTAGYTVTTESPRKTPQRPFRIPRTPSDKTPGRQSRVGCVSNLKNSIVEPSSPSQSESRASPEVADRQKRISLSLKEKGKRYSPQVGPSSSTPK